MIMDLPLYLMGAKTKSIGHTAENQENSKETVALFIRPAGHNRTGKERRDEQATIFQKIRYGQEIRMHEIGNSCNREQQAEPELTKKL